MPGIHRAVHFQTETNGAKIPVVSMATDCSQARHQQAQPHPPTKCPGPCRPRVRKQRYNQHRFSRVCTDMSPVLLLQPVLSSRTQKNAYAFSLRDPGTEALVSNNLSKLLPAHLRPSSLWKQIRNRRNSHHQKTSMRNCSMIHASKRLSVQEAG